MNPFTWLRRKVAESVVSGVADGMRAVAPEGEEVPADLTELRAILGAAVFPKALSAAEDDEPEPATKSRKKST